jgi:hypothetical protein
LRSKEIIMSVTIEWGGFDLQSSMDCTVFDSGAAPQSVMDANVPFRVRLNWTVPAVLAPYLGGSFRLRLFAESIGPGPEQQIGQAVVAVAPGSTSYTTDIVVPANALPGEGAGSPPVSGLYKIVAVVQHINGVATEGSGYSDGPMVQLRQP